MSEKSKINFANLLGMLVTSVVIYYLYVWPMLYTFSSAAYHYDGLSGYNAFFVFLPGINWLMVFQVPGKEGGYEFQQYGVWLASALPVIIWFVRWSNQQVNLKKEKALAAKILKENDEKQRLADVERRRKNVAHNIDKLDELQGESATTFTLIPSDLLDAHKHLDTAETHFDNRYFIPFWDEIEKALNKLGAFDDKILRIRKASVEHSQIVKNIDSKSHIFPITESDIRKLKRSELASNRMHQIVMKAQGDYEFSNIYLSIRTNQILVSGFKTLSEGIERMGAKISESIDFLDQSVKDATDSLGRSLDNIDSAVGSMAHNSKSVNASISQLEGLSSQQVDLLKSQRKEIKKTNEMLDNIRKRPQVEV